LSQGNPVHTSQVKFFEHWHLVWVPAASSLGWGVVLTSGATRNQAKIIGILQANCYATSRIILCTASWQHWTHIHQWQYWTLMIQKCDV
jgi:hypothetical protein